MLEFVMCYFVLVRALLRKQFRYIPMSILTVGYLLFLTQSLRGNHVFIQHHDLSRMVEQCLLILLFASVLYACLKRDAAGKLHPAPAVFCGLTCVARISRTILFNAYLSKLSEPGADVLSTHDEYYSYYQFTNALTGLFIFLMLACIVWHLYREPKIQSAAE